MTSTNCPNHSIDKRLRVNHNIDMIKHSKKYGTVAHVQAVGQRVSRADWNIAAVHPEEYAGLFAFGATLCEARENLAELIAYQLAATAEEMPGAIRVVCSTHKTFPTANLGSTDNKTA